MRILRSITSLCILAATALSAPLSHAKTPPAPKPTLTAAMLPTPTTMGVKPGVTTISVNDSLPVEVYLNGPISPTGTVTLSGGGYTSSAQTLISGEFTFTIPANALAVGTDTLTATYSGDANYAADTATATVTVTTAVPLGQSILGPIVNQTVAGAAHTCVLTSQSITQPETIQCWGSNSHGQLGNGTTADTTVPVVVPVASYTTLNTDDAAIVSLAAGDNHTCALLPASGLPVCWGANASGQLGNGTTTDSSTPVLISNLTNNVSALAAGSAHTCALLDDGTIECWGDNTHGQLGDNSTSNSPSPVAVSGITGAIAIAASGNHTCALLATGSLECWGQNTNGQLGNGSTTDSSKPVTVSNLGGTPTAFVLGAAHTCALLSNGSAKCWGSNAGGQLGNGTTTDSSTPVSVSSLTSATALTAGASHTCAAVSTGGGIVECWGLNASGQLGDNTTTSRSAPVQTAGLTSIASLAAGASHTCAQTTTGILQCWGLNANGQLGNATSQAGGVLTPLPVAGMGELAGSLFMGDTYACGLTAGGTAKLGAGGTLTTNGSPFCWGQNSDTLGDGTTNATTVPVSVLGLANKVKSLVTDTSGTCAILTDGTVQCWGNNANGILGNGTTTSSPKPVSVTGLTGAVSQMAITPYFACALITDGTVQCWGNNGYGSLGNGSTTNSTTPVKVTGLTGVTGLSGQNFHTCVVISDGTVKCWGDNVTTPTAVSGIATAKAITAGQDFNCALLADTTVTCWGRNVYGQLGNGSTSNQTDPLPPVAVTGLTGVTAISAGSEYTCALLSDQTVQCWGDNDRGGLGNGTTTDSSTPVKVIDLTNVTQLSVGGESSIALVSGGIIEGWGANLGSVFGDSVGMSSDNLATDHYVYPVPVYQGQSLVFNPPSNVALNTRTDLAPLTTATGGLTSFFDTWTNSECQITYNSTDTAYSALYTTSTFLCGARASNSGGYNLHGGSLTPAPAQARLVQVGAVQTSPQASLSPSNLTFTNITVGTTSAAQTITLSNPGTATLNITGITVTGTNASLFAETNTCDATLAAGANCSISVTFAPTIAGNASASISVADSATGSPQAVSLSGTTPAATAPQAALTPATANFGSVTIGSTSSAQTFTLTNAGTAALPITSVGLTGTNATLFALASNNCGTSLAAGAACNVTITFTPTAAGSATATLSIVDSVGTQSATLSATGAAVAAPQAALTPTTGAFGSVNVGSTSAAQTFTLSNAGTAALPISGITLGGTNASAFSFAGNTCGESLAAGSSCTLTVTFTPTAAGTASASLSVTDSVGTQVATFSGTGVALVAADFTIAAAPATQATTAGSTVTYAIQLGSVSSQNPFTSPVSLSATGLPGGTITFSPAAVTPGASGAPSTMTVQTTTQLLAQTHRHSPWPFTAPVLVALLLFLPNKKLRSRKLFTHLACLVAFIGIAVSTTGCGGGFALPSTARTYIITVTGTSGSLSHSTTVTLTVQ